MNPYVVLSDGWIRVPYVGPELGSVAIGLGESTPSVWKPAFLNTVNGERFAQIRPGEYVISEGTRVWLRINGQVSEIGSFGDAPTVPTVRRRRG